MFFCVSHAFGANMKCASSNNQSFGARSVVTKLDRSLSFFLSSAILDYSGTVQYYWTDYWTILNYTELILRSSWRSGQSGRTWPWSPGFEPRQVILGQSGEKCRKWPVGGARTRDSTVRCSRSNLCASKSWLNKKWLIIWLIVFHGWGRVWVWVLIIHFDNFSSPRVKPCRPAGVAQFSVQYSSVQFSTQYLILLYWTLQFSIPVQYSSVLSIQYCRTKVWSNWRMSELDLWDAIWIR